jgi:two-component system cell cycle response regulator
MSATTSARVATNDKTRARDQGRVLLVTDEPSVATYKSQLERAGFAVVGVTGGAAALISLRRTRPHIVLVDVNLRGIGADDLVNSIRRMQDGVQLLLLGESAATIVRRTDAISLGAFDYFQMPEEALLLLARTAQLVALKQQMDGLRAEADRDYLTGLANRRRFRTALGQEVERWRRYDVACALLLVDIDHMKQINDRYGHSAGDRVIRHIASSLLELSRDNDTAARLGGEEFALLLAGVDGSNAIAAAERLRQVVCATPVEEVGIVTISIGVASCPVHAKSERTLYSVSDAALYRAKGEGRNRTAVAEQIQV